MPKYTPQEMVLAMQVAAMASALQENRHAAVAREQAWPKDYACHVCQRDAAMMVSYLRQLNWALMPNPDSPQAQAS